MKTKQRMRMDVKGLTEDGSFTGLLSVYGNVDLGKDLVEPGAFTKTIRDRGNEVPLLWQHKADMPIGKLTLVDGPDALRVEGQLLMSVQKAQEAYLLMKAGVVKGLSIGFDTVRETMDAGVRRLKELRLWEGSVVTFPMNEAAVVLSVKSRASFELKDDFNAELAEAQLEAAGCMMQDALRSSLCSIVWAGDMSAEERVAAAASTIQQFTDAYLAYLPNWLDYIAGEYGGMESFAKHQAEQKMGRRISASTKKDLSGAYDHMKSATDLLAPLLADDAGDDTEEEAVVIPTSKADAGIEEKSAPVIEEIPIDHSAAHSLIDQMRALIPAA